MVHGIQPYTLGITSLVAQVSFKPCYSCKTEHVFSSKIRFGSMLSLLLARYGMPEDIIISPLVFSKRVFPSLFGDTKKIFSRERVGSDPKKSRSYVYAYPLLPE
jgi:hypothetical protein